MTAAVGTRSQLYWNTLLRIPVQIIVFVFSILVTRELDPKDFGVMAIVMMIIGYSNLLTSFGLNEAIIQKNISDKKLLHTIFTFDLFISTVLSASFYFLADVISLFFNEPEIANIMEIMVITFILTSFYGIPVAILRREMNFKMIVIIDSIRSLGMSITTYLLALNGYGYWSIVYGQLLPLFFITIFSLCVAKYLPFVFFSFAKFRTVVNFGWWNFLKSQLLFIGDHVDRFIIGKWLDATALGFYDKALTLSRAPYDSITININGVMFSSFSRLKDNPGQLTIQFLKSLTLLSYINLPIYAGGYLIAPYFVIGVLGDKWIPMIDTFQIILLAFLLNSYSGLLASFNVGVGKYKELTLRLMLAVFIFATSIYFMVDLGIEYVAYSYLLFNLLQVFFMTHLALNSLSCNFIDIIKSIKSGVYSSLIMVFILYLTISTILSDLTAINMVIIIVFGFSIFLTLILLDKTVEIVELKNRIKLDIKSFISK